MELLHVQIATALLQTATAFLLPSATRFITNYDRCYNVRSLLQIATVQPTPVPELCQGVYTNLSLFLDSL